MYHDFLGREIEDAEMDAMREDAALYADEMYSEEDNSSELDSPFSIIPRTQCSFEDCDESATWAYNGEAICHTHICMMRDMNSENAAEVRAVDADYVPDAGLGTDDHGNPFE